MKYMVMECHRAYAVVLDNEGRFLKVANLNYEVGQCVDHVVKMEEPRKVLQFGRMTRILSVAACLCLMVLGSGTYMMMPYGTVQIRINPHVEMTLNRLDYVTDLEGLNEDGRRLIEGTSTFGKKAEELTDELADKAMDMGYLSSGGRISLTVESKNGAWRISTEERIRKELDTHLEGKVEIVITLPEEMGQPEQPGDIQPGSAQPGSVQPESVQPESVQPGPVQSAEPSGVPAQNKVVIPIGPDSGSDYGAAADDSEDDDFADDDDSDDGATSYDGGADDADDDGADDADDSPGDDDIITYKVSEAADHNAGDNSGDDDSSDDDNDDDGNDDNSSDDDSDNDNSNNDDSSDDDSDNDDSSDDDSDDTDDD